MLKRWLSLVVLFCAMLLPLSAQEATFKLVSEITLENVASFSTLLSKSAEISPDGKWLAVPSSAESNKLVVFDTQNGELVASIDFSNVVSAAFSSDGKLLAVSGDDTVVFDLPKLLEIRTLTQANAAQAIEMGVLRNVIRSQKAYRALQLRFSPDNATLYTLDTLYLNSHLWDITQPSGDLSDLSSIEPPPSVPIVPLNNLKLVVGSFVFSEVGAFAVVSEGGEATNHSVVSIDSNGSMTLVGQPWLTTARATPYVSLDGSLVTLAEPSYTPEGMTLKTLRIRADDSPELLFTQFVPQGNAFGVAPNGMYGVVNTVVDGQAVAQFYATETGEIVGTLPIDDAINSMIVFSESKRFAVVDVDAEGNGTIRIFDTDLDFGLGITEVIAIDTLEMGVNVPTLSAPEDCKTDSESLTGETADSACSLSGNALKLDQLLSLRRENASIAFMYPSVMAFKQLSENAVILGTSEAVVERDFSVVPPMSAGEAVISVMVSKLSDLPITLAGATVTPHQVAQATVDFWKNIDVSLDGAIIDTFAGEYPASVAYFNNPNGDLMLLVAQIAPQFYAVFIAVSPPSEIALIEPTIYAMAETLIGASAD